jgi:hypothetical protein
MKDDNFLQTLNYVADKLKKIPELSEVVEAIQSDRKLQSDFTDSTVGYTKVVLYDYLFIIRSLVTLNDDDLVLVGRVNKKRKKIGLDTNPLGHYGIDVFYKNVNKGFRNFFWEILIKSLNFENSLFIKAVEDLSERMSLASRFAMEGITLKDGDPRADKVIWGHTRGLQFEATIHFVICHLIDRLTYQIFLKLDNGKFNHILKSKHYLFDPLGDIIFLLTSKKVINPEIAKRWILTRENGGLSWNTQEEQQVFDDFFKK